MDGHGFQHIYSTMYCHDRDIEVSPIPPRPEEHVRFVSVLVPEDVHVSSVLNVLDGAGILESNPGGPCDAVLRSGPRLRLIGMRGNELLLEDVNTR